MTNNVFEKMAARYDSEERKDLANIIVQAVRKELSDSQSKSLLEHSIMAKISS